MAYDFGFLSVACRCSYLPNHVAGERGHRRRTLLRIYADEIWLVTQFFRLCCRLSFLLAVSVEAIQSLVWRQRRKASSCTRRSGGNGEVHGKKAHFERLWSECLFIRFFVGNTKSTQNTMWWWRHGGLLNIITHQGFPISTHKHQNGANFWRAL